MRTRRALRPVSPWRYIAPTAAPTPHGSARSMLPLGADSYGSGSPTGLLVRVPTWASQGPRLPAWGSLYPPARAVRMGDHCHDPGFFWYGPPAVHGHGHYGRLYPPPRQIRGPFTSPAFHVRLGDDVAPGAPATSVTYPDILTSMDAVAVPALEPMDVWVPPGLKPAYGVAPPIGAPVAPTDPVFLTPGLTATTAGGAPSLLAVSGSAEPLWGPLTQTQWLYAAGAGAAVLLLLALSRRRR